MLQQNLLDFETEFRRRVLGIGRVLAMMGPWEDPAYLKRVWCIFEMFTAIQHGCEIEIVMPPLERERMSKILLGSSSAYGRSSKDKGGKDKGNKTQQQQQLGGVDALYKALANISVQNAQATIEDDRIRIMEILSDKHGIGFEAVNQRVTNYLRDWVRRAIDVIVEEQIHRMEATNDKQTNRSAITVDNKELSIGKPNLVTPAKAVSSTTASKRKKQSRKSKYRQTHAAFCTNVAMLFQRNGEYDAASKFVCLSSMNVTALLYVKLCPMILTASCRSLGRQ